MISATLFYFSAVVSLFSFPDFSRLQVGYQVVGRMEGDRAQSRDPQSLAGIEESITMGISGVTCCFWDLLLEALFLDGSVFVL